MSDEKQMPHYCADPNEQERLDDYWSTKSGPVTGYDAEGKAVRTKCELCGAESSVVFYKTPTGMRCLACYSKYAETWQPEEVE